MGGMGVPEAGPGASHPGAPTRWAWGVYVFAFPCGSVQRDVRIHQGF